MAPENKPHRRGKGRPFETGNAPEGRRWKKGETGNPGGRPRTLIELERQVRDTHGPRAVDVLEAMREAAMGVLVQDDDPKAEERVYLKPPDSNAARVYLDRVLGPARIHASDVRVEGDRELEEMLCTALGIEVTDLERVRASKVMTTTTGGTA